MISFPKSFGTDGLGSFSIYPFGSHFLVKFFNNRKDYSKIRLSWILHQITHLAQNFMSSCLLQMVCTSTQPNRTFMPINNQLKILKNSKLEFFGFPECFIALRVLLLNSARCFVLVFLDFTKEKRTKPKLQKHQIW